jgi:hypothetical protein
VVGKGCFIINIQNSSSNKLGYSVNLRFQVAQHFRDAQLLRSFEKYLGCGSVYKQSEYAVVFNVTKFSNISEKIIPFFDKFPLKGVKALDFVDFCKVAELMKTKAHLTAEGLEEIRQIKAGMNRGRTS